MTDINVWAATALPYVLQRMKPEIRRKLLPDHDKRPNGVVVDGALVHSMGEYVRNDHQKWGPVGEFPAHEWLKLKHYSAHVLIRPDGEIMECVESSRVAFHAGESVWRGRKNLNDSFLGAEWLVRGSHDYGSWLQTIAEPDCYTDKQYQSGAFVYAAWMASFPHLTLDRILAHSIVAGDDVRGAGKGKRDPGKGFKWDKFLAHLKWWLRYLDPDRADV